MIVLKAKIPTFLTPPCFARTGNASRNLFIGEGASNKSNHQMINIIDILPKLLSKAQEKFLVTLISTIMVVCGKVNFTKVF